MSNLAFLRWAGSKQKLIPQLKNHWSENYNRYIEPFLGSGQLFFSINPKKAILSDLNSELIEVYEQIKKNPNAVYKILSLLPTDKETYYTIREINAETLGINERAARFIYLNKLCFNGLYRTNSKGKFNVPYGEATSHFINNYELLKNISSKLENSKLISGDFETVILKHVKQGDFVYLDPPYAVENRRIFKQYGPNTFGIDDLKRLTNTLNYIHEKKAVFLLSYAQCKEALKSFSHWNISKTYTQRNIAGFSRHRRKAAELIVTNLTICSKSL